MSTSRRPATVAEYNREPTRPCPFDESFSGGCASPGPEIGPVDPRPPLPLSPVGAPYPSHMRLREPIIHDDCRAAPRASPGLGHEQPLGAPVQQAPSGWVSASKELCVSLLTHALSAAAAIYDEQDGDFHFTRGSKRVKTSAEPVAEPSVEPSPAPARKPVGRPRQTAGKKRQSSPPAQQQETPATTSRRSARQKAGSSPEPPRDDLSVPKPRAKGGRKPRASMERVEEAEETAKPRRMAASKVERTRMDVDDPPQPQQIVLPFADTPIINRNKELRKKGGQRRSSLGMRGRRASSLIENGHSAIPHREVDAAEFYKHIEAEGLSEPRRMRQLLTWCGERALSEKPPLGSSNSNVVLGGNAQPSCSCLPV